MTAKSTPAPSSVLGLANLFGTTHGKMRSLIGILISAGLIESDASPRGTRFRITEHGEQILGFASTNIRDFADILAIVRHPYGIATLHIIKQLNSK